MTLTLQQRVSLIRYFYIQNGQVSKALLAYRRDNEIKKQTGPCSESALRTLVAKFEKTGSVLDAPRTGRPEAVRAKTDAVQGTLETISQMTPHGESSLREVSRVTGIPLTTVHNITRNILGLHPYKLKRVQELKVVDYAKRVAFAERCIRHMGTEVDWLRKIFWTDEAHFHLHGGVNSHNCHIWTDQRPYVTVEKPLHDEYVSVWCGFSAEFIIGPYFFEEPTEHGFKRATITGARYLRLLSDYVVPHLVDRGALVTTIYQHDGAPAHINGVVTTFLRETFGDNVISRGSTFEWPPRSPDLTPADFWLWGFLKSRVYQRAPANLIELKTAICEEIAQINRDQLCSAVGSFVTRIGAVLQADGSHFEN